MDHRQRLELHPSPSGASGGRPLMTRPGVLLLAWYFALISGGPPTQLGPFRHIEDCRAARSLAVDKSSNVNTAITGCWEG